MSENYPSITAHDLAQAHEGGYALGVQDSMLRATQIERVLHAGQEVSPVVSPCRNRGGRWLSD